MDLVLDMVVMADMVWDTAMARGQLTLRLMPGTDMVASTATDSLPMADMATADTATARGPLMLRPSLRLMPGRIWWPLRLRTSSLWRLWLRRIRLRQEVR